MLRSTIFFLLLVLGASTQVAAKRGESIFDRWSHTTDKTITLRVNFDSLESLRLSTDAVRATIVDGGRSFDLDVTVRGRFRRRTCAVPPLKLQFDKDLLKQAGLNTHNDYKLVTHCTCDPAGQEALLREQLAYELYRTVNPAASLRTKLLTINYVNTADGSTTTSYGILIEDTDELESRISADNCKECYNAPVATYTNAEEVALFQAMIGNEDYSTTLVRNLKIMQGADGRLTAVPYDFDYCGLVSPTYADLPVATQVLKWEFTDAGDFAAAADHLLSLQDILTEQVANFPGLSKASKREIGKYLKTFFRSLQAGSIGA